MNRTRVLDRPPAASAPEAVVPAGAAGATGSGGEVAAGVRAMAPMLLGFAPFGLLVGAAVAASDNPLAAWLSTWTIYGGAAHLAVLEVLHRGSGTAAAILVGLLVNARIVAYSIALAPQWREASTLSKLAAAATLTDASWAVADAYPAPTAQARRRFYFGAAFTLWAGWPVLVTTGVFVGRWVEALPAGTLLPALTLGALAVRQLRNRATVVGAAAAATTAVVTSGLGGSWVLAVCALAGVLAASLTHWRTS